MAPAHTNVCVLFQLIDNNFSEWQSEYMKRVLVIIQYTFSQYYKTDRIGSFLKVTLSLAKY